MNTFPTGNVVGLAVAVLLLFAGAGLVGLAFWPNTVLVVVMMWLFRIVLFICGVVLIVLGVMGVVAETG